MKILQASLHDIDESHSVLYELSLKMSVGAVVEITTRTFKYTATKQSNNQICFIMNDLQNIFPDWKNGEFYSGKKIEGIIVESNYAASQKEIFTHFSNYNLALNQEQISEYKAIFWQEISCHFLLPPTHVFQHIPDTWSIFSGIYWEFCFIYLNDITKDGIVIAASAWD